MVSSAATDTTSKLIPCGDNEQRLLTVLLSGLAFALTWLILTLLRNCKGSDFCRRLSSWMPSCFVSRQQQQQQQQQHSQSSEHRPLAVFVFENGNRNSPGSDIAIATVSNENILIGGVSEGIVGANAEDGDDSEATRDEFLRNRRRNAALAAYDIEVLDSDGELDSETRERLEDVLLEYTAVMQTDSTFGLGGRPHLKYFNCLFNQADQSMSVQSQDGGVVVDTTVSVEEECSLSNVDDIDILVDGCKSLIENHQPAQNLRLSLKFFNDELRTVEASPTESIESFKKRHFSVELLRNQRVRLIWQGRELLPGPGRTLATCCVTNEATIHCLVTDSIAGSSNSLINHDRLLPQSDTEDSEGHEDEEDLDEDADYPGDVLSPWVFPVHCFSLVLTAWCLRMLYRLFSTTVAMSGASLLVCAIALSTMRISDFTEHFLLDDNSFDNYADVIDGVRRPVTVHRINMAANDTDG